jgi:hypothetical protein
MRIFVKIELINMKSRLNITVEETLIEQVKRYAANHGVSLSQLIEQYFKTLVRPKRKKNVRDLLNELPKPSGKTEGYKKQDYYEERKQKYGF